RHLQISIWQDRTFGLIRRSTGSATQRASRALPPIPTSVSPMPDRLRANSVTETIRPYRGRIAFTYALTVIEDLLELSYPWATGLAINGLLAQDYRMIAPVMIAWVLHTAAGSGRQMYDTRLYTKVYNAVVINTVLHQRQSRIEPSRVAARAAMARE